MAELTITERGLDRLVSETAKRLGMGVVWNGGITDLPSWEAGDAAGKGSGYVGLTPSGGWSVELMLASSSFEVEADSMEEALLIVRQLGGRLAEADEAIEEARGERAQAMKALAGARHRARQALAVEEFDGNDDEINVLRLALTEIRDAGWGDLQ